MQHLTPAELLRFLEEEAVTLQLINAKIADQLHWLQVEEDLFNRKLSNLEKDNASVVAIEYGQSGQDIHEELFNQQLSNVEKDGPSVLAIESGQSGQLSNVEYDKASVLAIESGQSGQDVDEEQFNGQLSNVENDGTSLLPIESGQSGQDLKEELFNRQLRNAGEDEVFVLAIESSHSIEDLNDKVDVETNFQNEIERGAVEMQSIALSTSTVEALGSSPNPLQSPGTKRYASGDGQEANEIVALGKDDNIEMDLQGQQQEQEDRQAKEETSLPRRSPRKRVSRRPARFRE